MKTFITSLFFFNLALIYAQDVELIDYNWTIEKIVTEELTLTANEEDVDILFIEDFDGSISFELVACAGQFDLLNSENEFKIFNLGCAISMEQSEVVEFFFDVFIFEEADEEITDEGSMYGPFTYAFREEDDKIYLDITNNEGSVATFWTSTLSTPNFNEIEFSFYPNPVKDLLNIESPQSELQKIQIFDMNGKQVLQLDMVGQETIDVSQLKSGVYLLQVETREGKATRKLVKE